ncbi:MAG: thiamine pyrophosphate-binding protein [Caldilineaceae bacterium]
MPTVADLLAQTLQAAGIDTVFGLPGGENVAVMDALRRHNFRFVLARNESSAVFMADVTARLTGKPSVCLTTLGPGAANAVAGVAHAYLERTPVLIITAQTPEHLLAYHTHQVLDLGTLFAPITKGTFTVDAANAQETIAHTLRLTVAGRPGPVHLRISNEAAAQPVSTAAATGNLLPPEPPTHSDVSAARACLTQAEKPVVVAGLGLEPEGPYSVLQTLAEALHAPVITTPKAKGALPEDHPLAAGVIGLTRTDPAYQILDEADCILAVGFDVVELVKPWQQTAPLVWVAAWANVDPTITAVAECVGPLEPLLGQLADTGFTPHPAWGATRVAALRQALAQQILPPPAPERLLPQTVLQIVRQTIPRATLVTTDVGSHKILAGLTWPAYAPNRYMVSNGLSCMGFALPAAIAASLALPGQAIVCFTGDAGFSMVLGELGLLTELNLPVIVVLFNDNALDLIRSAQVRAGKPVYGTEFINPNFCQIATAYRLDAYRVQTEAECAKALQTALVNQRPALIEALIDPSSYPTTPRKAVDSRQ